VNFLLKALPLAALGLVFVASAASRGPIRIHRRPKAVHSDEMARIVHRGLVLHVCLLAACCAAVLAAPWLPPRLFVLFLLGLLAARLVGYWIGSRWSRALHPFGLLLAPVDGAALLIDWALTLLFSGRDAGAPAAAAGIDPLHQVLLLEKRTVEQVMIPRSEIVWLPAHAVLDEFVPAVRRRPHSRYPVLEGDFEQPIGILLLRDLLRPHASQMKAGDLARPVVVVPETIGCDDLLQRMRADRIDIAMVVDEFGAMAGLVTLEDVLELLVGELEGEHEVVPVRYRRMEDGAYVVAGSLRIDEFEDLFGVPLPEGDYETLAGLFLSRSARIPGVGEKLDLGAVRLEVASATERRIRSLRLTIRPGGEESEAASRS